MHRNALIAVLFTIGALAVASFLWFGGGSFEPSPVEMPTATEQVVTTSTAGDADRESAPTDASSRRAEIASSEDNLEDDPEIRAAMCGFKGRVVDHRMTPQAGCGVRMYRGALDSLLRDGFGKIAELAAVEPQYVAGEVKTAADGTFLLHGVWPQGFYLLFAGIGTDAPTHKILQQTPAPGEVLDLGDIVLNDAAVAVGKVVDENGKPVAGALVMAADVPGAAVDFFPAERFDPKGCLLIREASSPIQVLDMPPWVARVFEHLPIPMTRTATDGAFRLVGVQPGMNLVAAVQNGLVPALEKSVKFEKGQTRDLGEMTLREGEEVTVKVVDAAGKPVVGAEVVAGTTSAMAPVDLASRIGVTDKEGRVTALGFGRGKVTAAARRSPRDAWSLAEPQPTLRDVIVTLPTTSSLQVLVTLQGAPVAEPKLQLMRGTRANEAMLTAIFGLQPPLDLTDRAKKTEDGRIEITDVPHGRYLLVAKAEGAAAGFTNVEVKDGVAQATIDLVPSRDFVVRVLGPGDAPIRNASIYVAAHGNSDGVRDLPQSAGRTAKDGSLQVSDLSSEEFYVSAQHPKWGLAHERGKLVDGEVTVRFREPGWIEGSVLKGGKPLPAGKFAVVVSERPDWDNRKYAVETVPSFATPMSDGAFTIRALQPGRYSVETMPALDALRSPGGMVEMMSGMFMFDGESDREQVEVVSGQAVRCALDVGGEVYDGPVGSVFGTVLIDGVAADGAVVQSWDSHRRRGAKCDATGRFEMRDVPAGSVHLLMRASATDHEQMWSGSVEVPAGQSKDVLIDVRTTHIAGVVLKPDGSPASSVHLGIHGTGLEGGNEHNSSIWRSVSADSEGRFKADRLPEGIYKIEHRGHGEGAQFRGEIADIRIEAGRPRTDVVLRLKASIVVKGRVDLTPLGKAPQWGWISLQTADPSAPNDRHKTSGNTNSGIGVNDKGEFDSNEFDEGVYWGEFHFNSGEDWETWEIVEPIRVPTGGQDLILSLQRKAPPKAEGGR